MATGVYLTKRQLDAAMDGSRNSPTRLMRNLLSVFFPQEVLAKSSALGSHQKNAKVLLVDGYIWALFDQAAVRCCHEWE